MRLCIVGGALQGMEAVFLASKAGYETVVIDKRPEAPALSICDEAHVIDPILDGDKAKEIYRSCDAVLPACENHRLLEFLNDQMRGIDAPLLFDLRAYDVSQSKIESNRLMGEAGVPLPGPWPDCGFPVIVKPSSQSGSVGVSVAHDEEELERGLDTVRKLGDVPVIQEFVHGKSVSIEVIGNGKSARSYVTTEVVLDGGYDCKEVRCFPDILDPEQQRGFEECSARTAEKLGLCGLMDVEAILTPKGLRYLEVDARIPSQTPAAILTATGINLLKELVESRLSSVRQTKSTGGSGIYWHLHFRDGVLLTTGEKEFSHVSRPRMVSGLFGSDDAITDYEEGRTEWHGTFMVSGEDPETAISRRDSVIKAAMEACGAREFRDASPKEV